MNEFAQLGNAFLAVCHPASLMFMFAGVIIGIIFGAYSGIIRFYGCSLNVAINI